METAGFRFSFASTNVEWFPLACAMNDTTTNASLASRRVLSLALAAYLLLWLAGFACLYSVFGFVAAIGVPLILVFPLVVGIRMRGKWQSPRPRESVLLSALLLCTVGIAGCQLSSVDGDVRSAAREAQCKTNLRTLYGALVKYVSLHGDVPRGKDGEASIDPLDDPKVQEEVGIDSSTLRCPADNNSSEPSYVLNPALSVHDLGRDSAIIIACDRLPSHLGARTHNSVTVVLIGDGTTVVMDLPLKEQKDWRRLFLSGDKGACSVSMRDGSKENWTSSGVMWYVGREKGRVPNE